LKERKKKKKLFNIFLRKKSGLSDIELVTLTNHNVTSKFFSFSLSQGLGYFN